MARISQSVAGGQNVLAFLDMIAYSEGTSTSPLTQDDGYDVIVTGIKPDGTKWPEIFMDYSQHPFVNRKPKQIKGTLFSSASGRYQHMRVHWEHYRDELKLRDFGPESQDLWALKLIRERKALDDIKAGRIEQAIGKCSNIWASFPGNTYGQPMHNVNKLLAAYKAAGGVVA